MGKFEMDFLTHFDSLHMYSFQRVIVPSDEYLVEAMVGKYPLACVSFIVSTSLKNETGPYKHCYFCFKLA